MFRGRKRIRNVVAVTIIATLCVIAMLIFAGCGSQKTVVTDSDLLSEESHNNDVDNNERDDNDVGDDVIDDNSDQEDLSKRVFTIDDFAFIEKGKTTLTEVHTRIGCYSTAYLSRGYGSDEIYPTADPYVCIEIVYFQNDYVIFDVLIQQGDYPIEIELIPFTEDSLEDDVFR